MKQTVGGVEGSLRIRVEVKAEVIVSVALNSTRPVDACSILVGRPLDEAMALLPRLFSLCGSAQAVAGLRAMEAALDLVPSPPQTAARQILVAAEALEQTVWRLLIDGPRCVGVSPALETLKRLRRVLASLRPLLFPDPVWMRVGGVRLVPDRAGLAAALDEIEQSVDQAVLGRMPMEGSPWQDCADFEAWVRAAASPAAMTLRWVSERGGGWPILDVAPWSLCPPLIARGSRDGWRTTPTTHFARGRITQARSAKPAPWPDAGSIL
jgi:hypothetical protein